MYEKVLRIRVSMKMKVKSTKRVTTQLLRVPATERQRIRSVQKDAEEALVKLLAVNEETHWKAPYRKQYHTSYKT